VRSSRPKNAPISFQVSRRRFATGFPSNGVISRFVPNCPCLPVAPGASVNGLYPFLAAGFDHSLPDARILLVSSSRVPILGDCVRVTQKRSSVPTSLRTSCYVSPEALARVLGDRTKRGFTSSYFDPNSSIGIFIRHLLPDSYSPDLQASTVKKSEEITCKRP
jgi:hypothetical protein